MIHFSCKTSLNFFISSVYIEHTTADRSTLPDVADFVVNRTRSFSGQDEAKIAWKPNYNGTPGSHFYAHFRIRGEPTFQTTKSEIIKNYIIVSSLEPNKEYEFRVVSVDRGFERPSETKSSTVLDETQSFNVKTETNYEDYYEDY